MRVRAFCFVAVAGLLSLGGRVWAQPLKNAVPPRAEASPSEGTVLALDGEQLVVDVGESKGGAVGLSVELWRPVKLKHPVTGAIISDRYRLGELKLLQVRPTLSLAEVSGTLARPPAVGDVVVLHSGRFIPPVVDRPASEPSNLPRVGTPNGETTSGASANDGEAQGLAALFDSLNQGTIPERIRKLEHYVQSRPQGRFSEALQEEAQMLRRLLKPAAVDKGAAQSPKADKTTPLPRWFVGPSEVTEDTPLQLALEVSSEAKGAILYLRPQGKKTYDSLPMENIGHGYFSVTISPDRLATDRVEYFIDAIDEDGEAKPIVAHADKPSDFAVVRKPGVESRGTYRMSAALLTDYADFNRLRGNDRMWQTEGYLGIRFQSLGVRALRSGFGVLRGVSGSVEELDRELDPRPGREIGLTYGYLELELGLWESFSMIGRGVVGLLDDGISGGAQVFVRFGSDLGTNLMVGGEVLGGVGLRTIAQLELGMFEKVPMLLRAETTNQPAGGSPSRADTDTAQLESERGTRLIVQAGYRVLPKLTLSARASMQGRTIWHAGPGVGGMVGYRW